MKVLAIDSSNKAMAVALADSGTVLGVKKINIKRNHSIQLMPAIESLVEEIGWQAGDIDRIAVANGPGSYTGVRIAVTTAKTMAWALGADLVTYSSLQALALGITTPSKLLVSPLFDARRQNVYTGLYQVDSGGHLKNVKADIHISLEDWLSELKDLDQDILFVGEDVKNFEDTIQATLGDHFLYNPYGNHLPKVEVMALQAPKCQPVNVHELTPDYLKLTEAEENYNKDHPDQKRGPLVEKIETEDHWLLQANHS